MSREVRVEKEKAKSVEESALVSPPGSRPTTKADQRRATTNRLIAEARKLFAEKGYADTSLEEITDAAEVTKGALYHYFRGKKDLFGAVVAQVHREVAEQVAGAAPDADPWTQLVAGCRSFLEATNHPDARRILLVDAPSVLGWESWRHHDAATSLQELQSVLTVLIERGEIAAQPVEPLAHLLSGAMNEVALWLSQSESPSRDLELVMAPLTTMLESFRT